MNADGTTTVLLRRLDALELEIRKAPTYPAKADLEFAFDQVLSTAQRLAGTRGREVDVGRRFRDWARRRPGGAVDLDRCGPEVVAKLRAEFEADEAIDAADEARS